MFTVQQFVLLLESVANYQGHGAKHRTAMTQLQDQLWKVTREAVLEVNVYGVIPMFPGPGT